MTVVRMLWEHVDRVQLSAARLNEVMEGWGQLTNVGEEILSIAMRMCPTEQSEGGRNTVEERRRRNAKASRRGARRC